MKTLVLLPRWVPNSITLLHTPMLANLVCTPLFKHARTVNALLVDAFLHTSSCLPSGPLKWGGSFTTSLKINSILLWHHLSIFLPPFPTNPHHFYSPKTLCILPLNFRCCLHKINLFFSWKTNLIFNQTFWSSEAALFNNLFYKKKTSFMYHTWTLFFTWK